MSLIPDRSFPIWRVSATPAAAIAPLPGEVAGFACDAGAAFLVIRPSVRSFSGWVCVVYFSSTITAASFADICATRFGFPYCRVRDLGSWCGVSVPACVREWSRVRGSLPCLVVSFHQ